MKTNLSTKTITGISLMALFIVGCSGGDQNSTRPSFQSPSSPRSFPLSGGTSSSVAPSAPAESNVSGNEEPAAPQTAAAENGNADIQEAIDAANAAAAAATQAAAASNNAASSADGAQTAGIVAAVLGGLGIAASVGGDYLVNKKSSERDAETVKEVKIGQNVAAAGVNETRQLRGEVAGGFETIEEGNSLESALQAARAALANLPDSKKSEFEDKIKEAVSVEDLEKVTDQIQGAVAAHREDEAEKLEAEKARLNAQVAHLAEGSREAFNKRIKAAKNFGDLLAISQNINTALIRQDLAGFQKSALENVAEVKEVVDGLGPTLTALNTTLETGAKQMTDELKNVTDELKRARTDIQGASTKADVEKALKAVTDSVRSTWEAQIESFKSELQKQIDSKITEAAEKAGDAATQAAGNAINGLKTELSSLTEAVNNLPETLGNSLRDQLRALGTLTEISNRLTKIEQILKEAAARKVAVEEEEDPNQTIETAEEVVQVVVVEGSPGVATDPASGLDEIQSPDAAKQPAVKEKQEGDSLVLND